MHRNARILFLVGLVILGVWPAAATAAHRAIAVPHGAHKAAAAKTPVKKIVLDPVTKVITAEGDAGQLTPTEVGYELTSWKAASTAVTALLKKHSTTRAAEIQDVQAIATAMASSKQLTSERVEPVLSSLRATVYVMTKVSAYPYYGQQIQIPGDALVYEFFPGEGVQFHPKDNFAKANALAAQKNSIALVALQTRLLQVMVHRSGFVAWEYYFNWEGSGPGWISALSQGTAVQSLARTTVLTGDPQWSALAAQAIPSFALTAEQGGVSEPQSGGTWYLNYPFHPTERILNVDLYALIGLHEYAVDNPADTTAMALFNSGVTATEAMLPQFDTGAWSLYEIGEESPLNYQEDVETALGKLYGITKWMPFRTEQGNFQLYEAAPPTIAPDQTPHTLTVVPAVAAKTVKKAGVKHLIKGTPAKAAPVGVGFTLDKISNVTITIRAANGALVRTISLGKLGHGAHVVTWDGSSSAGKLVAVGTYSANITATDLVGNRSIPAASGPITVVVGGSAAATPITPATPVTPAAPATAVVGPAGGA